LHVRPTPALAAAREHEGVGGRVQPRQVAGVEQVGVDDDRRRLARAEVRTDPLPHGGDGGPVLCEALAQERHVVVRREGERPRIEEDVPALAVGEVEVGEEREAARLDGQRLRARAKRSKSSVPGSTRSRSPGTPPRWKVSTLNSDGTQISSHSSARWTNTW